MPAHRDFNTALLFGLVLPVPALVATSLIDAKTVLLRLALTVLFSLSLGWLLSLTSFRKPAELQNRLPEAGLVPIVNNSISFPQPAKSPNIIIQVGWRSFTGQVNAAVLPLLIGFALASAIMVYVPAYWIRSWLGEGAWLAPYLAALIAAPLQLSGGAEVVLASALLTKGAGLGSALSTMLVAPITTFFVIRHIPLRMNVKTVSLYLVAAWFVAGSLGVAIDTVQQLLK